MTRHTSSNHSPHHDALVEAWGPSLDMGSTVSQHTYGGSPAPAHKRTSSPTLPQIDVPTASTADGEFQITELLGKGAMARVDLAYQRSLAREVAIKSLHESAQNEASVVSDLLHEARITGFLDHPHIVPVHALGRDADGKVRLVMKRIEGTEWLDLLRNPEHPMWHDLLQEWGDPLHAHLQILMRVAAAVHFANERGVVHRDIKPANVMVGKFGEVYLVDWGIAERITTLEQERAQPSDPDGPAAVGTPAYMAPEMLQARADARSDVYLLGATLHQILTGRGRHRGANLRAVLFSISQSVPVSYDDDVPSSLAEVANRATAQDPEDRFESALEFRRALSTFFHCRTSERLRSAADAQYDSLRALSHENGDTLDQARHSYSTCEFSYRMALQEWSKNDRATDGLERALECMARWEITERHADAAERLLAEHRDPPPALIASYEELTAELRAKEQRLKELDPSLGRRSRGRLIAFFAILSTAASSLLLIAIPDWESLSPRFLVGLAASASTVCGLLSAALYSRFKDNPQHVRWLALLNLLFLMTLGHRLLGYVHETPIAHILTGDIFLFAVFTTVSALLIDRRLFAVAGLALAASGMAALFPSWAMVIVGTMFCFVFFPIAYIASTARSTSEVVDSKGSRNASPPTS